MADQDTIQDPDFDKMFDSLAQLKPGDPTPTSEPAIEPAIEPATEPAPAPEPVVDQPVEPVVEPATEPGVEPAPTSSADDAIARLADLLAQRQPAPAQQPAPQAPPLYNDDELEVLNTFQKDYPDIAQALAIVLRGQTAQNNAFVFNEVAGVLGQQMETMQSVQVNQQLNDLRRAIPDYDTIRDPVIAWARSQSHPDYLRAAYESVIQQGDVGQIKHLADTWRSATGQPAASVQSAPQPKASKANELSPAVKQAAASLAPVNSLRTAQAPSEPVGFDDAFDLYAKAKK